MAKLELSRLVLFAIEWTLSVVCLVLFPSSLYRTTVGEGKHVCAIGSPNFCRFGIAWCLAAVVILTVCIAWHLSEYCSRFVLPPLLEILILVILTIWWLVAALAFSLRKVNTEIVDVTSGARKALRASSWFLVLLLIGSAVISWSIARSDDCAVDPMLGNETHEQTQGTGYSAYV